MKKLVPTLVILLISVSLSAQYKKASFFEKQGRTYELGTQYYALGSASNPLGFKIGFGRDRGKHLFSYWELQLVLPYKYSYTTTDTYSNQPVKVEGKTQPILIYGLNYGYHLLNSNSESKIKPYVTAGLTIILAGGINPDAETITPTAYSYDLKKQTDWSEFSMGVGGGLGCFYNFTEKWGLKVQAGYEHQLQVSVEEPGSEEVYKPYKSHPYVSLGVRLRIVSE